MSHKLELLPAIDVKDGLAVRLVQGELSATSKYGNPLEVAAEFVAAGAQWIHLVDLDAAFGTGSNHALLEEVIKSVDLKVELSGGIRDDQTLRRALATGCTRVNLGTAALENPAWTANLVPALRLDLMLEDTRWQHVVGPKKEVISLKF
jgi:phosphoribosylformimino-5-aminoimidazole carboxamide ribonucleotide (ProFAR) isomerase